MSRNADYFKYLLTRSRLGRIYRNFWAYPRLARHISGNTLDVGCGIGDMLAYLPGTVGVDVNQLMVDYCRSQGLDAHLMEVDKLPFEDSSFDCVILDNVLEHLDSPDKLLSEIRRVLRQPGSLLVGVPGERGYKSDSDHKVFYNESQLIECLCQAGFVHRKSFSTPLWKSSFLSRHLRQYCLYGQFELNCNYKK